MPVYEYQCARCGNFSQMRSLADSSLPGNCPTCGDLAPKQFPIVNLRSMRAENRQAWARNEQSAHAPHLCSSSCSHQRGTKPKKPADRPRFSASSKANSRPWMLGH